MNKHKFIIDYNKWRSGESNSYCTAKDNSVGKGNTHLLNDHGYMCCLGQILQQCEVPDKDLLNISYPFALAHEFKASWMFTESQNLKPAVHNLARINDDGSMSPQARIAKLKEAAAKLNVQLEFINVPKEDLIND